MYSAREHLENIHSLGLLHVGYHPSVSRLCVPPPSAFKGAPALRSMPTYAAGYGSYPGPSPLVRRRKSVGSRVGLSATGRTQLSHPPSPLVCHNGIVIARVRPWHDLTLLLPWVPLEKIIHVSRIVDRLVNRLVNTKQHLSGFSHARTCVCVSVCVFVYLSLCVCVIWVAGWV